MKKLIIYIILLFLLVFTAAAFNGSITNDMASLDTTGGGENTYRGVRISMNTNSYWLVNVTLDSSVDCSVSACVCKLWNATAGISPAVYVTSSKYDNAKDVSYFNGTTRLVGGQTYIIACGVQAPDVYNMRFENGGSTLPDSRPEFTWDDSGYIASGTNNYGVVAGNLYNILKIGLENRTSAPAGPSISINITTPGDYQGVKASDIVGGNLYIIGNINDTVDDGCTINDTKFNSGGYLPFPSPWFSFKNTTLIPDGVYTVAVWCNKTGYTNATDISSFTVDTNSPEIQPAVDLANNKTYVWNGTLSTAINFTDNLEIYSINISFCNGTIIYNKTNIGLTEYNHYINYGVSPTTIGCFNARVCDAHTDQFIQSIDTEQTGQGIKYVIDRWLWIDKEYIKITPKDPINSFKASTTKQTDRYSFTLPRATTYIVESSHYIDVDKSQKYGGHLIVPTIGDKGYWIDFNTGDATKYIITRISPTKVEIEILGLKGDLINFNSIGELNCIENKYWYNNLNPNSQISNQKLANEPGTFNLSLTSAPGFITSLNATVYYNHSLLYGGTVSNFSVGYTTPLFFGLNLSLPTYWTLRVNGYPHNLTEVTQTVNNLFIDNCSNSSFFKAGEVYFKNLDGTPRITNSTLSITGEASYYNLAEVSNFSLCVYPNYINLSSTFSIQFSNAGATQYYTDTLGFTNQSLTTIILYLQSGTETTTFTIKDKDTYMALENVYASMLRLVGGSWTVVESKLSDLTGRAQFTYIEDVEYKFILSKNNYQTYTFNLNPILFTEYDVLLTKDAVINETPDYDRIALYYSPKIFYNDLTNNFTFTIVSPYNELIAYGYTLTYPGGTTTNSGSNSKGEQLYDEFIITGATPSDRLRLDYYYNIPTSGLRSYTYYYSIQIGNNTMIANRTATYGLGLLERVLIAVFIAIMVVGIATLIGQPIAGLGLGLIMLGYLSYIGFLPVWTILLPIIIGLIILGSRPEG